MRVGFFSPLPPQKTGVADYSAALLDALRRFAPNGSSVQVDDRAAGVALYHIGNNQLHQAIYAQAIAKPGVVVLHDAVLQHFFLGSLAEQDYIDEVVYNYGEWNRDLAKELWLGRARSAADLKYFNYPMLKRIAERSQAVVVHNPRAAAMVEAHVPGTKVIEIPHLFAQPEPVSYDHVMRLRNEMGIPAGIFLFGVFGHLRESKRLFTVLRAFESVAADNQAALLIAGPFASRDLERAIAPLLARAGIHRIGYVPNQDFWHYAGAVDACVNLRYPAAGETSGIAIRLMGIGKTVILSEGEETRRFPETACLRVDHGAAEVDMLADFMRWFIRFPQHAKDIGQRGAQHISAHHSPERVARLYWQALEN